MKLFWMLGAIITLYFSGAFVMYTIINGAFRGVTKMQFMYVLGMFLGLAGVVCIHMVM